ncbi:MAG: oligoendopeptidase F [Oceanospirillaceae bacterium]|nr:oligoendopeptidase F [Oceanospirillaceae bacterium]|tara:strand:+ start:31254 stop:33191 length:1938 start_codon:yes stop_codon:yes gene_type:complete
MTELKLSRWIRAVTLTAGVTLLMGCGESEEKTTAAAEKTTSATVEVAEAATTEKYVWDLTDLYASDEAWDAAYAEAETMIAGLSDYKGTLGKSSESMATAMRAVSDTYKEVLRLYVYTSLKRDEDQRVPEAQTQYGKAMSLYQKLGEAISWMDPEILSVGKDTVLSYMEENEDLAPFVFHLKDTLRQADHTLDAKGEALLAQAGMSMAQPEEIYSLYANASIPWPTITLSDGKEVKLTQAGYSQYRAAQNRDDRKKVFDTFWETWKTYENGMGATLNSEVQANIFMAKARNYDSVLEQNMFDDALPEEIYTQLVSQVNDALPVFHRYLKLRGKMLGVEDLRYYDIYPPLTKGSEKVFGLSLSEEITFEALKPFGDEYLGMLREGLDGDWMHSHPQDGKRSGAYMNGSAYDVHPYVLLNHNDDYNALSTFAHEWGHAVHTMMAKSAQPFETSDYSTFIAEMASTINEILLEEYMVAHAETKEEKLFYLGQALESIRGTFFRQTMFGEFELAIHQAAEAGEPLTGAKFSEIYGDLLRKYHGEAEGVLMIDDAYTVEWAYIPHFYYDFYVYQYATSISGAAWFAEQFLAGDEAVRDNFIEVLKAGGSDYPQNILLDHAGLDMTKPDAYQAVVRRMTGLMDRIDALLES